MNILSFYIKKMFWPNLQWSARLLSVYLYEQVNN
jgi:hypothetical protein